MGEIQENIESVMAAIEKRGLQWLIRTDDGNGYMANVYGPGLTNDLRKVPTDRSVAYSKSRIQALSAALVYYEPMKNSLVDLRKVGV